jgi:hypothetical protein
VLRPPARRAARKAFGLVLVLARPLPGLSAAAPPVRALLLAVLPVVAAQAQSGASRHTAGARHVQDRQRPG